MVVELARWPTAGPTAYGRVRRVRMLLYATSSVLLMRSALGHCPEGVK